MDSILDIVIKPECTIIGGNFDLEKLCSNPDPIHHSKSILQLGVQFDSKSTELILKKKNKMDLHNLAPNSNPKLEHLITKKPDWSDISRISSIETSFILSNSADVEYFPLSSDTNSIVSEIDSETDS